MLSVNLVGFVCLVPHHLSAWMCLGSLSVICPMSLPQVAVLIWEERDEFLTKVMTTKYTLMKYQL